MHQHTTAHWTNSHNKDHNIYLCPLPKGWCSLSVPGWSKLGHKVPCALTAGRLAWCARFPFLCNWVWEWCSLASNSQACSSESITGLSIKLCRQFLDRYRTWLITLSRVQNSIKQTQQKVVSIYLLIWCFSPCFLNLWADNFCKEEKTSLQTSQCWVLKSLCTPVEVAAHCDDIFAKGVKQKFVILLLTGVLPLALTKPTICSKHTRSPCQAT